MLASPLASVSGTLTERFPKGVVAGEFRLTDIALNADQIDEIIETIVSLE